jgi:hypothetical protein
MRFATSYDALLRPYLQDPLDADLFRSNPEALCAELSRLVYYAFPPSQARLSAALTAHNFADWHYFENPASNTQALALLDHAGTAHVVFRGTESTSLLDILTDAAIGKRRWHMGGRVHRGFASAYAGKGSTRWIDRDGRHGPLHDRGFSIRDCLGAWLAQHARGRLVATGHSLGGALATLLASEHPRCELVTFGCPRVGNGAFAALFDDPARVVWRFRDCCDLVSRVPPEWIGFRHPHGLRHIDREGTLRAWPEDSPDIAADRRAARRDYRRVPRLNLTQVKLRGMADHAPVNYVSALLRRREPLI